MLLGVCEDISDLILREAFGRPASPARDDWGEFPIQLSNSCQDVRPHCRGALRPGFASVSPVLDQQRAQGKPGARCTRGPVC
jgi:hypothetical protein